MATSKDSKAVLQTTNQDDLEKDEPRQEQSDEKANFVPADEFNRFQSATSAQLEQINQNLQAVIAGSARTVQVQEASTVPTIKEPTEEEIQEAFDGGQGASMMRRLAQIEAQKQLSSSVDPRFNQGLQALRNLTRETATSQLKHYKRYQKEIDSYLEQLPSDALINPEVYKLAHNAVVADHLEELIKERALAVVEHMQREGAEDPTDPLLSEIIPRRKPTEASLNKIPTVEELCGQEAAAALKHRKLSPDQFAQSLGYESWEKYTETAKQLVEMEAANG